MINDALSFVRFVAADAPPSNDSGSVVIAIIGAVGVVLAATVPVLVARRRIPEQRRMPLNSDSATDGHSDPRDARIAALETFLTRRHYDPNVIITGRENPADVHFD